MPAWIWKGGKFVYKHRKKIRRAVSIHKLKKRVYEKSRSNKESRAGEHTSRSSGTPETGKSMPGPSAHKGKRVAKRTPARRRSRRTSSKPPAPGRGVMRARLPYRKGGCPPGYRYDRRRKMCVLTNKLL